MYRQINHRFPTASAALLLLGMGAALVTGCASDDSISGGGVSATDAGNSANRILACKSSDRLIDDRSQCLLDDAACYQIKTGQWCTGERGNICPSGSTELPAGSSCPTGARCFKFSESLECMI